MCSLVCFRYVSPLSSHNAGYQSDWLSAWSVCCTMGHEGGGRGHLSLSDRVIISENSPVISPLLAKYPNDSRADIQCHANSLTTSCQGSAGLFSENWHFILNSAHCCHRIKTKDDENKILWVVLMTGWRDSCQALARAAWNSLRLRLKLNNCLNPLFSNEFFLLQNI